MISERPLDHERLRGIDVTLDHELGFGRDFQITRDRLRETHGTLAQKSREQEFVDRWWQGCRRRIDRRRIRPDRDDHWHPLSLLSHLAPVCRPDLVPLPVHCQRARAQHLHAVHANVADAALRILRDHHWQCDVRSAVFGPASDDRQLRQIHLVALQHHFLARRLAAPNARRKLSELEQPRKHRQLAHDALRHLEIEHLGDARADLVEIVHAEREGHSPHRAEEVDDDGILRPLARIENHVFEVKSTAPAGLFHYAIRDLAQLETRFHGLTNTRHLSGAIDGGQELRDVIEAHLAPMELLGRSPTWIAATPNDRLDHVTLLNPAFSNFFASSSSTGKFATDRGR